LANAWAEDGSSRSGRELLGHVDAARLMVERGAEVNPASRNDPGVMPLHCAAHGIQVRYEPLALLEHGADPDARQQDDFTALMAADQHGDERLRSLLVEHGA
jgi:ankyrin repeat protein